MEDINLDYLAGLVDADGCIGINKRKASVKGRTINPTYLPSLIVVNTNQRLLADLSEQFGGTVNKDKRGTGARWALYSVQACMLLELLLPRLRIKKRQAYICLELQSGIGLRSSLEMYGSRINEEELERREALYLRIKELNSGSYGKTKENY